MLAKAPLYGVNVANHPDSGIMGSWGAMYAYYGFTLCDMVGNCAEQPRVAGYC